MWVIKTSYMWKKHVCNPIACICENGKYLASTMDDSMIMCDEIIYAEETNFNEKYIICEKQNFYIFLVFLLIPIALLIAINVYWSLIKYWAKQKHLLSFHDTKLKLVFVNSMNQKSVIKSKV